ncbi:hypothetical protein GEV33_001045 [Tenebrio molitor]|uniref:Uncharacterized protein n=1 Tax=Tenebrio molitor TaxID=7067 RepID=A0A8J6HTT7_TENMO|nr:hypothetical protein GEV33_001045 [Tenebrio molitor]
MEGHTISTTYTDSYGPKPFSRIDPAVKWDQKLDAEESNFVSQVGRNELPNYFENFASTYDLSYNHFPKCFPSCIPRVLNFRMEIRQPTEEYIYPFGNLTKYGLLDYKKEQWGCEIQEPRRNYSTHYNDTFVAPNTKDYTFKRFAIPAANSSLMHNANAQSLTLKLRDSLMCNVTPAYDLVQVPRPITWNPITWECVPPKCTCNVNTQ